MFCKIELLPRQSRLPDDTEELIWYFLCSLEQNGQILKEYKLIKTEPYTMYVTLPKPDSFQEKYDGVYVRRDREKLRALFDWKVTPLGENLESTAYCTCGQRTAIEMQTYNRDVDSVFTCCDCGKPIVLYELPFPAKDQEDHWAVQNWQENYAAMDQLWMNCLCDRYTGGQRVKPDSALNRQGMEIAAYMSGQLGCPVYYYLASDYGRSVKTEKHGGQQIHVCPKCGTLMKRVKFSGDHERDICQNCSLSCDAH